MRLTDTTLSMSRALRLVSVSRVLPTPDDPSQGIFVLNRLSAMSKMADLTIVQPVPYFPLLKPRPDWGSEQIGSLLRVPMFYLPGVLKFLDAAWLLRSVGSRIKELHESKPFDAIDAHFGYPDGAACVELGERMQVPVVVTLRGVENEQLQSHLIGQRLRHALDRASGCICVSHFLADLAVRNGVDERKIVVIHNSVERRLFHPGAPSRSRRELGLPVDRPIVVSIGHLVPRKRHHVLVEAFANSKVRHAGAFLAILGSTTQDARYTARLNDLVREKGLEGSVRLVGNRPPSEIGDYLRAADAFALLSAREGCCNAVLEALACGLPVITTDVGDNKYFVNASNGLIVAVDQAQEAADAIAGVVTKSWSRVSIAASLPVGDWSDVAQRALGYISELVSARTCDVASI